MELRHGVRLALILFMGIYVMYGLMANLRHIFAYSTWGFLLVTANEIWIFIHEWRFSFMPRPRAFWILSQIAWAANCLIVVIFWGYLYFTELVTMPCQNSRWVHTRFVLTHTLPISVLMVEMYKRRIEYLSGDFKWIVWYQAVYGAINAAQTYVTQTPIYPILTWKDWTSILFMTISCLLITAFDFLGRQISHLYPNHDSTPTSPAANALGARKMR